MPVRVQLSRKKGYRKPEGAIVVARPSKWGNPYVVFMASNPLGNTPENHDLIGWFASGWGVPEAGLIHWTDQRDTGASIPSLRRRALTTDGFRMAVADSVDLFRRHVALKVGTSGFALVEEAKAELRGHDLACWCPLDQPCHADVLLELANS